MATLITQPDGSVLWDYDVPDEDAAPKPGSKAALQLEAAALGLSTEGTKDELIARIAAHDPEES